MSYFSKDGLPEYIKNNNHDDWLWPFSYIPRSWSSYTFPMPSYKVLGNANPEFIEIQPDYSLAFDAQIELRPSPFGGETKQLLSMQPVHPVGQWSVQAVDCLGLKIPCYFTFTSKAFGRRIYFNIGCKPDVSYNLDDKTKNWHWAFPECSLTFNRI